MKKVIIVLSIILIGIIALAIFLPLIANHDAQSIMPPRD